MKNITDVIINCADSEKELGLRAAKNFRRIAGYLPEVVNNDSNIFTASHSNGSKIIFTEKDGRLYTGDWKIVKKYNR